MNRNEIIEKLRQNMPDFQGNDEEIEIKKALYIYLELGKMKSFDERYYFGNEETKRKIYHLAKSQENNIDKIASQRKIICVSLTYLYCYILREFGIDAIASEPEEGGHIKPIIITKNRKAFVADLQLDLENIQTKSRLKHFEYKGDLLQDSDIRSNQDTITKMLIEMHYIKKESDYKNEEIEKLKEQVKSKNPHDALRTILEDEELYRENEEMKSVEVNKFYKRVLKNVLPNFWERRIYAFQCYRQKEENEKDYTLCVFSEEEDIKPYLFSKKDRKFLRVEISKMKQLEKEGLKFGARPKENGSRKLQKYVNKQVQKEKRDIEFK